MPSTKDRVAKLAKQIPADSPEESRLLAGLLVHRFPMAPDLPEEPEQEPEGKATEGGGR